MIFVLISIICMIYLPFPILLSLTGGVILFPTSILSLLFSFLSQSSIIFPLVLLPRIGFVLSPFLSLSTKQISSCLHASSNEVNLATLHTSQSHVRAIGGGGGTVLMGRDFGLKVREDLYFSYTHPSPLYSL